MADAQKPKHPGGRPTTYNAEIAEQICDETATTNKSLASICEQENFPAWRTVYGWLRKHAEFAQMYAQAKEDQAERMAEEIVCISDECMIGEKVKVKSSGEIETTTGDMVERSKLRVDARKWVAAKLLPRKYGDRNQIEFPDKDGNPQMVGGILGDTERSARLLFLLEQAEKRSKGGKS